MRHKSLNVLLQAWIPVLAFASVPASVAASKVPASGIEAPAVLELVDSVMIREVVVTGVRNATDAKLIPNTVTGISREKLAESHEFSLLPSVLELTPGLFSTSRGVLGYGVSTGSAGNIRIRGVGGPSQVLVLIDGQPQFAGLMSHPIPDVYQTIAAEKVEVLRGPSSLYYGSNAMGGVINIVTRSMQEDGFHADADIQAGSFGTFQGQASGRFRKGRLMGLAGVQYQRTDGHRENSEFEQTAGFMKLGYDLSGYWKLNADVNLTHFNASNPGPEQAPLYDNDSRITRGLASVQVSNDYGWTNGTLRVFYDWGHHDVDDGSADIAVLPTAQIYRHDDYITGFNMYQSAGLFEGNRVTAGVEFQNYGGSAWNEDRHSGNRTYLVKDANGNVVEQQSVNVAAAYADFRQSFGSWLTLDAGIRMDRHSVIGTEWVPQAGAVFHVSSSDNIKLLVSKGFRYPTIKDMYMFPPATVELEPERAVSWELAYDGTYGTGLSYSANAYYVKGENLINTVRIDGRPRNVNVGSFRHWGVEASLSYQLGRHWAADANCSLLHMDNPVEGAPEHKAFAGIAYHKDRLTLHPTVMYVGNLYLTGGENGIRESYTLLDVSASYSLCNNIQLFVRGDNLLGRRYQTYYGYHMPRATFTGGIRLNF